jgi:ribosomal protein L30/L7E
MDKKLKIEKMKGPVNYDNSKHDVTLKLLNLENPRPSTRVHGVA